ncbi:hypothetical protein GG681_09440 [Epibacterium sp. SM1969]|uniref:DUF4259 domain-containing protein n=1 Tax=Tritonibacter aquimaris TaxID=2663379 RepID=A0A844ALN7_9RHOB|nr:hypothetical protein [Tritonibacter aquimaris]MQY42865.1 hypothetical protein [Tritonibacter aquimaris]
MGTWGYKVGEDDVFRDVYDFFFDTYNQGASPEEASERVLEEMSGCFSDDDDQYEAYLALAFAQWETQYKDVGTIEEVERFISTGESLRNWSGRGGDETLLKRRRRALNSFLRKIKKPRRSKKRRVHIVPEFQEAILVDLIAPDNRKALTIQEIYMDGRFIHTSAMVMWSEGGGSIFHSDRSGLEICAEWLGSQNLQICFLNAGEEDLSFGIGNPNEAFFCGDRVKLVYKFSD